MKVLFVARHNQVNSNDDEGAIAHALLKLGHEVHALPEESAISAPTCGHDLLLFLKWRDAGAVRRIKCPRAFWYFDRVEFDDPTLHARSEARKAWMREMLPIVDVGFCTDGDFVANDVSGKLVWLPQGADERVVGRGNGEESIDVLFTGIRKGGQGRASFVEEMERHYGPRFRHVERGIHGRDLANLIAQAKVVVAPDSPVSDRYWSNRVYLTLGFGGFLLHPYCDWLKAHYSHGSDLGQFIYYRSRKHLHELIRYFLPEEKLRREVGQRALDRTLAEHTYRHRVAELLRVCRERGLVP
jgi:hypothetical protein